MVPTTKIVSHQSDSRQHKLHNECHPQSQLNICVDGYHNMRYLYILATVATVLRYATPQTQQRDVICPFHYFLEFSFSQRYYMKLID